MKKPQLKNEEKYKPYPEDYKAPNEGTLAKANNNTYAPNYNSLQNLKPANMVLKDADSPNKADPGVRNSRRPDFFKNFTKNGNAQQGLERRSFK